MFDSVVQLEIFPTTLDLRRIDLAGNMQRYYCLRAPRFLRLFSVGAWRDRFEVGSGLVTVGLAGGFVAVVRCLWLDPSRVAA